MRHLPFLPPLLMSSVLLASPGWANCSLSGIDAARSNALSAYQSNQSSEAEQQLSQYYSHCDFYDMANQSDPVFQRGLWLISDLMFYRQKNSNPLDCLALGDDVYDTWLVSDPTRHSKKVEKALQSNLSQCRQALAKNYTKARACPITGFEHLYAIPTSWREQDEIYFETACLGFVENSKNVVANDRDGRKFQSEGMNSIARLEMLYIKDLSRTNKDSNIQWAPSYQLDQLYITGQHGKLWGTGQCYTFDLQFGKNAGELLLDGSSSFCQGGSASFINRLLIRLAPPLAASVTKETSHIFK